MIGRCISFFAKVGADLRAARPDARLKTARPEVGRYPATLALPVFCFLIWPGLAHAATLTELKVFPSDVNLKTQQDRQLVVVQAIYADGITRDVTAQAQYSVGNQKLVKFDQFTLRPLVDGTTELKVTFDAKTVLVPIKIESAKVEEPVSFAK